jgi:hypothetical protein
VHYTARVSFCHFVSISSWETSLPKNFDPNFFIFIFTRRREMGRGSKNQKKHSRTVSPSHVSARAGASAIDAGVRAAASGGNGGNPARRIEFVPSRSEPRLRVGDDSDVE